MAVSTTNAFSGPYLTNGATVVFPFTFTAPSASEVAVFLRDASGIETAATGYSVALTDGGGGSVTFTMPPAAGSSLYAVLNPYFTQDLEFENGSAWTAEPVNEGHDRSALRDQVLRRDVQRGILAPIGEAGLTLPSKGSRSGKVLGFGVDPDVLLPLNAGGADDALRGDLASSDYRLGGGLVAFQRKELGATKSDVRRELNFFVRPEQFGAVGDGKADDTAAIQKAANAIAYGGGSVWLSQTYRIASILNIPAGVSLIGDFRCTRGRPILGNAAVDFSKMASGLRIDSTATIVLNGSCAASGLVIYRYGMVFPATPSSTTEDWAGTALTINGDDVTVDNCLVMGFSKGYYSSASARNRINRCNFDNLTCIEITNNGDRCYISETHCWPQATICDGQSWKNLIRPGFAFYLHDFVDWGSLVNCFSYGYKRGFRLLNVNSTTLILCGADNAFDNVSLNTGSIGIEVEGACDDTKISMCQTAAHQAAGVNINVSDGKTVLVEGHSSWGHVGISAGHGILVTSGNAIIKGGVIRNARYGISIASPNSYVLVDRMAFNLISVIPINPAVVTSKLRVGCNHYGDFTGTPVGSNSQALVLNSADPLPIDNYQDEFIVTGSTAFGSLTNGWKGREIQLYFSSALTVFNGTGATSAIRLSGGANFAAGAGSVLCLRHNGVQWYEVSRA